MNAVFILEVDTGDFIERHTVPHADETDCLCANVVEQVGNGCLTARNKNTVWGNLFIDMGLTGTAWTEFAVVEIVFYQWNHTRQQQPLYTLREVVWFHTGRTEHDREPFFFGESLAPIFDFVHVDMRHLDRCQLINSDGTDSLIFFDKFIFKLDDAPDTAAEQPIIFGSVFRLNWNVFDSEVGKLSLIAVFLDVQLDRQLINNRVAAALTQNGQDLLRLVRRTKLSARIFLTL